MEEQYFLMKWGELPVDQVRLLRVLETEIHQIRVRHKFKKQMLE
jgi:hypothetical protein